MATGGTTGILISTNGGLTWSTKLFPLAWHGPSLVATSCVAAACMSVGSDPTSTIDIVITTSTHAWVAHQATTTYPSTSVSCESATTCFSTGTDVDTGPGGKIAGVYKTINAGASWTLLSQPPTGQPGVIACSGSTCHSFGTGLFRFPTVDQLATSTTGGTSWSSDVAPKGIQIFSVARSSGHWIAVGESALGGPEIILK
jgi:hypothetical protein